MKFRIVHCATLMLVLPIFLKIVASGNVNDKIKFILNPGGSGESILNLENPESLKPLSKFKCIKILTHGGDGRCNASDYQKLAIAYKKHKKYCSVVCVDWPTLATYSLKASNYYKSANNSLIVGKRVAEFLIVLQANKVIENLDNVHLIGLSLGAQVMGVAGHYSGGKVSRITGLDPACPTFDTDKPLDERLDKTDGKYVDVIHTSAGVVGTPLLIGHSDFFPDGGVIQKKCKAFFSKDMHLDGAVNPKKCPILVLKAVILDPLKAKQITCSHLIALTYFVKSIDNPKFCICCKCDSFKHFEENKCDCTKKNLAPMGEPSKPGTTGTYYCDVPSY